MRRALAFFQLLASGAIAAAALSVIASNRGHLLDPDTAAFLLLFIQWQTLALTVTKAGTELVVFTTVTRNPSLHYRFGPVILRQVLPISVGAGLVCAFVFDPLAGVALAASVALDSYSLLALNELTARARFGRAAGANLLNYPLFFLGGAILIA